MMNSQQNLGKCICILLISAISVSIISTVVVCQEEFENFHGAGTVTASTGQAGTVCYIQSLTNKEWLHVDSNEEVGLSDEKTKWKITRIRTNPAIYSIRYGDYWLAGGSEKWDSVWLTDESGNEIYWRLIEMDNDPDIYSIETYNVPDKCSTHCMFGSKESGVGVGCYSSNNEYHSKSATGWKLFDLNIEPIRVY